MASFILLDFLHEAAERRADVLYLIPGSPIHIRCGGTIVKAGDVLMPGDTEQLLREIYALAKRSVDVHGPIRNDDNFSFTLPGVARFRVSLFRQRNSFGCILRMIPFSLPTSEELHLPPEVLNAVSYSHGLVLVTGYSGSGKTTTLAALIRQINQTKVGKVIMTLENPLEYLHSHGRSMVIQREIFTDTENYASGIQAALYQKPDVLMIGDLPDEKAVRLTIRAARSGQLVFSTLYGSSSSDAVAGLLTMFSLDEQKIICSQLAKVLRMVIYQKMVPGIDGTPMPVFETVEISDVFQKLLQQNDMEGFRDAVANSKAAGAVPFDRNLVSCFRKKLISGETAVDNAMDKAGVRRMIH